MFAWKLFFSTFLVDIKLFNVVSEVYLCYSKAMLCYRTHHKLILRIFLPSGFTHHIPIKYLHFPKKESKTGRPSCPLIYSCAVLWNVNVISSQSKVYWRLKKRENCNNLHIYFFCQGVFVKNDGKKLRLQEISDKNMYFSIVQKR